MVFSKRDLWPKKKRWEEGAGGGKQGHCEVDSRGRLRKVLVSLCFLLQFSETNIFSFQKKTCFQFELSSKVSFQLGVYDFTATNSRIIQVSEIGLLIDLFLILVIGGCYIHNSTNIFAHLKSILGDFKFFITIRKEQFLRKALYFTFI